MLSSSVFYLAVVFLIQSSQSISPQKGICTIWRRGREGERRKTTSHTSEKNILVSGRFLNLKISYTLKLGKVVIATIKFIIREIDKLSHPSILQHGKTYTNPKQHLNQVRVLICIFFFNPVYIPSVESINTVFSWNTVFQEKFKSFKLQNKCLLTYCKTVLS